MRADQWIIEKRVFGVLDLSAPQPEQFFGDKAITGITEDQIAKVVYRHVDARGGKDVVLDGRNIAFWPSLIDGSFVARRKTW